MARARVSSRPETHVWRPRKLPRQSRSQATFDAILEACARILRESGLAAVSTNSVAERAGVSVGSLYEFFPGREAILAALVERRLSLLAPAVASALEQANALDASSAVRLLISRLTELIHADRELFHTLLREVPMLRHLPETKQALAVFFEIGRSGATRERARVDLPAPEADAWLIGRMVANGVLEIAFLDDGAPEREVLIEELARLTYRMLRARDIDPPRGKTRRARTSE